jgi:triacylglycerol esterase/lipase EstA (alpha/beta hydrolase family)
MLGTLEIHPVLQTYQGIDRCGERLAEEVSTYVEQHLALQRISVVGHSMGGLIARYALGMLSHPARDPSYGGSFIPLASVNVPNIFIPP